ncbi:UxaA family hydrolase [Arenibacter sp. ARW7G5Y1]|uniref:UxaA family hydrolase n=1 Tax=Arenibacter sp. ARW7G5Y1 TaxID=2135619 RepID=UPI000D76B6AE|nr:UxaA family hydrolase [Arenibacter sp. ARW7G5Y1]PXX21846.1 SAF domain-containing protein [Arenibacter sp. ARW7G5Y1]
MESFKKLIQLSDKDNVLVVCRDIESGEVLQLGSENYLIKEFIALGHKIASRDIAFGEAIVKFNVAIGSALRDIKRGEHVHVHNIKSDFIPTYIIDKGTDV